jgi:type II secretory pathway pseudopilin PulG
MRSRARRGITLFESVAALTIVGLVAISALEAVGAEMRTAERARRALEVEALATMRLDALELLNDQELQAIPDSVAAGQFDDPLGEYTWTIESTPVAELPGVYDVALTINWENGSYPIHTKMYRRPRLIQARGGGR